MNDKVERPARQPNERYRDNRDDRVSEDQFGDQRWLRSPDQEFETSEPYRQPSPDAGSQETDPAPKAPPAPARPPAKPVPKRKA